MKTRNTILLLFLATISALAQENKWNDLKSWIGKYPTDGQKRFFQLPNIQNRLKELLNQNDIKHLTEELSVEAPVENVNGYLIIKVCREHWCPSDNALLAINLNNEGMHVGFYEHRGNKEIVRWFYSQPEDKLDDLPKEILDEFLYMHQPKP